MYCVTVASGEQPRMPHTPDGESRKHERMKEGLNRYVSAPETVRDDDAEALQRPVPGHLGYPLLPEE